MLGREKSQGTKRGGHILLLSAGALLPKPLKRIVRRFMVMSERMYGKTLQVRLWVLVSAHVLASSFVLPRSRQEENCHELS